MDICKLSKWDVVLSHPAYNTHSVLCSTRCIPDYILCKVRESVSRAASQVHIYLQGCPLLCFTNITRHKTSQDCSTPVWFLTAVL